MAGAIKHMERSHRATALKRNSGAFNQFHRNAYAVAAVKQQRKMTLGQKLKSALKRDTRKES
jgi:hypothetical protein